MIFELSDIKVKYLHHIVIALLLALSSSPTCKTLDRYVGGDSFIKQTVCFDVLFVYCMFEKYLFMLISMMTPCGGSFWSKAYAYPGIWNLRASGEYASWGTV